MSGINQVVPGPYFQIKNGDHPCPWIYNNYYSRKGCALVKNHIFILLLLAGFSPSAYAEVPTESGDLESYLNGITFGVENDRVFKIPTANQLANFESVVTLVLHGNYELANANAQQLDYELVAYMDTVSAQLYYVLREIYPIPSPLANGGGIYIFQPSATYNVAIHAPHPKADMNTNKGAVLTFMTSDVRYFMMASSYRRSHPDPSTCQNIADYRPSDAVHNSAHYFFVAHKAMEDFDNTIHYIEFHGFAASLDTILSQCDTGGNMAIANISETLSDSDADEHTLMHSLETVLNNGGEIKACIYSTILDTGPDDKYTLSLGGTTNVPGRYTNGSSSVCDQAALPENNTHRYVHFEQSWAMRETAVMRETVAGFVSQAIRDYFNDLPFEMNVGLNDAWYELATSGQGFFITVFPDLGLVSLAWFTYDTELTPEDTFANLGDPGHRWLTAIGQIDGDHSVMGITLTSGGLFDTATEIQRTDPPGSDGTLTLTFDNCNSGTVEYDITSINRKGIVLIKRVADDNIVLCEALNAD